VNYAHGIVISATTSAETERGGGGERKRGKGKEERNGDEGGQLSASLSLSFETALE